jgi:hypothetical protein
LGGRSGVGYGDAVLTQPADLGDDAITEALRRHWDWPAVAAQYQAVGFGSHHWTVTDAGGARLFATVDDLAAKRNGAGDTDDAAFGRLAAAFAAARALREEAGLSFVVAPLPAADGRLLVRLRPGYSLVVHPYLDGHPASDSWSFRTAAERRAVIGLLAEIHRAGTSAPADDFAGPDLDGLGALPGLAGRPWDSGPYGERARRLLAAQAHGVEVLTGAYRALAARAAARPERMVVTHGEPHAGNVLVTPAGLRLVDWDTALLAPPERDLWALAADDPSVLDAYAAATGTEIDRDALALYRLWFDLDEIGNYLELFRAPHGQTADTALSWQELQHYLRPAARWPALFAGRP